ncbi:hypothetical protein [Microbacterium sp. GXS0129]|uniref:hypothetical protein n=1 Tax=Microbacterium sp. GXS0129 TaxID=3377836 RepID=UPI00383AEE2D
MPNRFPRVIATLVATTALALGLSVAAPATAAPFVGAVRSFDGETVGAAPTGCTVVGDVTVQPAALAGAPASNRAVRLTDASTSAHTRMTCTHAASAQKSVTFRLLAAQMDTGAIVSLGTSATDALGMVSAGGGVVATGHEEHGFLRGADDPRVGDIVRIRPNHACGAVNMHHRIVVTEDDVVTGLWPVLARH